MTGSKLYPRRNYKTGAVESGGVLYKNTRQKSATHPDWSGQLYLEGYGWIWLSGWTNNNRQPPLIRLAVEPVSDEKAEKYLAPKERRAAGAERRPPPRQNGRETGESDEPEIPF